MERRLPHDTLNPNKVLKRRIDEWRADKKKARKAAQAEAKRTAGAAAAEQARLSEQSGEAESTGTGASAS